MATVTKLLYVDVAKKNLFPMLVAKQLDKGSRFLRIQLMNEGVSFAVETGASVAINALRPDGEHDDFDGTVNDDGTVTVPLSAWMLEIAGVLTCDVTITHADERLTTMSFRVEVQKATYPGTTISQED